MRTSIVLTLTGSDRVGLVEEVTKSLLELDANIEMSKAARLGGEFVMLALVSAPSETLPQLDASFAPLLAQGYAVTFTPTQEPAGIHAGWAPFSISVQGADHEGIVHDIAAGLSAQGISIESMETSVSEAPVTGQPLFALDASVVVPPSLEQAVWTAALADAARDAGVDAEVTAG